MKKNYKPCNLYFITVFRKKHKKIVLTFADPQNKAYSNKSLTSQPSALHILCKVAKLVFISPRSMRPTVVF